MWTLTPMTSSHQQCENVNLFATTIFTISNVSMSEALHHMIKSAKTRGHQRWTKHEQRFKGVDYLHAVSSLITLAHHCTGSDSCTGLDSSTSTASCLPGRDVTSSNHICLPLTTDSQRLMVHLVTGWDDKTRDRQTLDGGPDPFPWSVTRKYALHYSGRHPLSPHWSRILGLPAGTFRGSRWQEMLHPAWSRFQATIRKSQPSNERTRASHGRAPSWWHRSNVLTSFITFGAN